MISSSQVNFYYALLVQAQQKRTVLVQKRDRLIQRIANLDDIISGYEQRLDPNYIERVTWNPVTGRYEECL